jgi:hypothetical protein
MSKIGSGAQQLVRSISDVASKTAAKVSPIRTVTVISRNPDGSLNVDDGLGGCQRIAPKANVRIGQKITLGTEPAIGTQTNLPLLTLSIDPSSKPCPDDQRGCIPSPGFPCPAPQSDPFLRAVAGVFALRWDDINSPGYTILGPDDPPPGRSSTWSNRLAPAAGVIHSDPNREVFSFSSRRSTSYTPASPTGADAPFADQFYFGCHRVFIEFDTSTLPIGATVLSANLQLVIAPNLPISDGAASIIVVPSQADGTTSIANWTAWTRHNLAEVPISDIIAARPGSFQWNFAFDFVDPADGTAFSDHFTPSGVTRFAILTSFDFNNVAPPVAASFPWPGLPAGEHSLSDSVLFNNATDVVLTLTYVMPAVP